MDQTILLNIKINENYSKILKILPDQDIEDAVEDFCQENNINLIQKTKIYKTLEQLLLQENQEEEINSEENQEVEINSEENQEEINYEQNQEKEQIIDKNILSQNESENFEDKLKEIYNQKRNPKTKNVDVFINSNKQLKKSNNFQLNFQNISEIDSKEEIQYDDEYSEKNHVQKTKDFHLNTQEKQEPQTLSSKYEHWVNKINDKQNSGKKKKLQKTQSMKSNDHFYQKGIKFLKKKQNFIENEKEKKRKFEEEKELQELTPKKLKKSKSIYGQKIEDKLLSYQSIYKLKRKKLQEKYNKDKNKELTFRPKTNNKNKKINLEEDIFYNKIHDRLYYQGKEQEIKKEEENQKKFEKIHTFQPNSYKKKQYKSQVFERLSQTNQNFKNKQIKYLRNNYDEITGQPLFQPQITEFNHKAIQSANKIKINQEIREKSKILEKQIREIFYFLTQNEKILKIEYLDADYMDNKCVILLKDIIIAAIKQNQNLDLDDFVNLILENNLINQVIRSQNMIKKFTLQKPQKKPKNILEENIDSSILKNYEKIFREKKIKSQIITQNQLINLLNNVGRQRFCYYQ